ncbi:protocadherin-9-like [Crocuta crocuta]
MAEISQEQEHPGTPGEYCSHPVSLAKASSKMSSPRGWAPHCCHAPCSWAEVIDSRPLPDVALTGKCTRECDEYGHSDSCWMPVRTSPERKKSQPKLSTFMPVDERGSQEKLANGEAAIMGDRNRNLLNKKLTSSYETFSAASFSKNEEANPEDIPLTKTGEYKPSPVNTLTRREVYL